ncbi:MULTISPECIES: helix-turn-helix domain-containing protein [Amycolatopsis]|uniref:HxlR family transcriptional regulator n=1 Tax=Amycolatopsis keratiniphila TaxID=129921 RepID=R4T1A7_9PSEU|nr:MULTISPECIES: helix-turn-helix domain-containing protein [Amycolatopsis]AGM04443.1 HxlR family transcriptional regulator [Amycolatopsis keratiniphila]RSN20349.1 transcriptional regulator [Amycolatopsis sp. WAC 04169]UMP00999.1 helix-turn-helix transcriptional regulator [Amycolatopsis sp. EV170708-02-1]
MTARTYGQFCGLARALEIIGERWSLLVIRDLVLGPKRFDELQHGLPKIPTSILSTRLNELERHGVVQRRVLSQLDAGVVYELTEYGNDLDQILLQLGLWGARSLTDPAADDLFTLDAAILSLYTTFQPDAARGIDCAFELHYGDQMIVHAVVEDGAMTAGEGPHPNPDLVIEPRGPVVLKLLNGEMDAASALTCGAVAIKGEPAMLELFTRLFHIPSAPSKAEGLVTH